jgi:hypothetical protein
MALKTAAILALVLALLIPMFTVCLPASAVPIVSPDAWEWHHPLVLAP